MVCSKPFDANMSGVKILDLPLSTIPNGGLLNVCGSNCTQCGVSTVKVLIVFRVL